jgi:large subunit ribosomal protein L25
LLSLQLEDGAQLVLPKSVQRDPVRHGIEHVDLVAVRSGEKVTVEVVVRTDGKIAPGGLLEHVHDTIAIEADATKIPSELSVDVEGLEVGSSVRASDVALPEGVVLVAEADLVLLHVLAAQSAAAEADEAADLAAAAAASEASAAAAAPAEDDV